MRSDWPGGPRGAIGAHGREASHAIADFPRRSQLHGAAGTLKQRLAHLGRPTPNGLRKRCAVGTHPVECLWGQELNDVAVFARNPLEVGADGGPALSRVVKANYSHVARVVHRSWFVVRVGGGLPEEVGELVLVDDPPRALVRSALQRTPPRRASPGPPRSAWPPPPSGRRPLASPRPRRAAWSAPGRRRARPDTSRGAGSAACARRLASRVALGRGRVAPFEQGIQLGRRSRLLNEPNEQALVGDRIVTPRRPRCGRSR